MGSLTPLRSGRSSLRCGAFGLALSWTVSSSWLIAMEDRSGKACGVGQGFTAVADLRQQLGLSRRACTLSTYWRLIGVTFVSSSCSSVCELDLEGIVAKQADSPYKAGRQATWLKDEEPRLLTA